MPFQIVRNDITQMSVDAIVNAANPKPGIGFGCETAIHNKAGMGLLLARRRAGYIPVGSSAITGGYRLPAAHVIHTATPVWQDGKQDETAQLRSCYDSALQLALEHGCSSIAFPLLSAGNHGFPKDIALQIALGAFGAFLQEHELQIYLVVFSKSAFALTKQLFQSIESYIDEHYILEKTMEEYGVADKCEVRELQQKKLLRQIQARKYREGASAPARPPVPRSQSLDRMLQQLDAGFTETLLKLIDDSCKKDSEIYKKANLTRQHFSKIRNNPHYKPTKETALALAIALELDLTQTADLIGRAGFALTNSSKQDVILQYFISRGNYDLLEINAALFEFDQPLLGT